MAYGIAYGGLCPDGIAAGYVFCRQFAQHRETIQRIQADFVQKEIVSDEVLTSKGKLLYIERALFTYSRRRS